MRSLPIVLAILAAMFYIAGTTMETTFLALLLGAVAVMLGIFEWVSERSPDAG
jgi:uncharacterized membrane protein HdeD (DUF308 family)